MHLYNSLTGQVEPFTPIVKDQVSMYVCGATVQSAPHIGHLRSAVVFDALRRWFEHNHRKVIFVRNITDIDDKILEKASENEQWWEVANRVEKEFHRAYEKVGVKRPTVEPKVTGHIYEIMDFIEKLDNKGFSYMKEDGIYFKISQLEKLDKEFHYGAISNHIVERVDSIDGKSDADFALWKFAKPGEPKSALWESVSIPLGRPGWHIECSAMSKKYLGSNFDIHGGGVDLKFPHHENEKAQSNALGDKFANHWVHNGLITVDGQKMSKSLGNFITAEDYLTKTSASIARYELLSSHYRSSMDLSDSRSVESSVAFASIMNLLNTGRHIDTGETILPEAFVEALNDDFNTPVAFSVLHEIVSQGFSSFANSDAVEFEKAVQEVASMMRVLGFDDVFIDHSTTLYGVLDVITSIRDTMRASKDYEASDKLREDLSKFGIALNDGKNGTEWMLT